MKLDTRSFGHIEFEEEKKIIFEEGIPGFEHLKAFIMIEDEEEDSPFSYLQSTEDGNVSFIITNPYLFKANYAPRIPESCLSKLGGAETEAYAIFAIVTATEEMTNSSLNLSAPLLIHEDTRRGMQIILDDKRYKVKHKIIDLLSEGSEITC